LKIKLKASWGKFVQFVKDLPKIILFPFFVIAFVIFVIIVLMVTGTKK